MHPLPLGPQLQPQPQLELELQLQLQQQVWSRNATGVDDLIGTTEIHLDAFSRKFKGQLSGDEELMLNTGGTLRVTLWCSIGPYAPPWSGVSGNGSPQMPESPNSASAHSASSPRRFNDGPEGQLQLTAPKLTEREGDFSRLRCPPTAPRHCAGPPAVTKPCATPPPLAG